MRSVLAAFIALVAVAFAASPARAEHEEISGAMIGPVFGLTWGKDVPLHGMVGLEVGTGYGPFLRGNAGMTWRNQELFAYLEADAWYILGATVGMGYGTRSEWQAIVGVWEALPVYDDGCGDNAKVGVISAGYRWTGLHELYIGGKYGTAGVPCFT